MMLEGKQREVERKKGDRSLVTGTWRYRNKLQRELPAIVK